MSIIDLLLNQIAPFDCLNCNQEGSLVCDDCLHALPRITERCYRCHSASPGFETCADCLPSTRITKVQPAVIYQGTAKDLIWKLKSQGAKRAATIMSKLMLAGLASTRESCLLVPVPTSSDRIRQRGYDQAVLLAKELSRQTCLPLSRSLARKSKAHQVGTDSVTRRRQLADAFYLKGGQNLRGKIIILIDDVVTTGSTLEAAAQVFAGAGIDSVEARVFAQPLMRKELVAQA